MKFTNRIYGVEIEIKTTNGNGDRLTTRQIASAIQQQGIICHAEGYNHNDVNYWKVITDSSCGYEVVSPKLSGTAGLEEIRKVIAGLDRVDAKVDRRCGLHVHVDARDLSKKEISKIFLNYAKWEKTFDHLMPNSRRANNNGFAGTIRHIFNSDIDAFIKNPAGRMPSRYLKVNLCSLSRHGSIEFRQHSGTTSFAKIKNWVVLLVAFVEKSRKGHYAREEAQNGIWNFKRWAKLFGIADQPEIAELADYITARFQELNDGLSSDQVLA